MDIFSALSDPTRRGIVEMLASRGELAAGDIGRGFKTSPSAISQHLKALREANLVQVHTHAQKRIYSVNAGGLAELEDWLRKTRRFRHSRADSDDDLPYGGTTDE